MKVDFGNNINFGHKIPTASFLKMGSGIFDYNDAKNLCMAFDTKFPGHVGYYQKALKHVANIEKKNTNFHQIFLDIGHYMDRKSKLGRVAELTKELGQEIDVVI